MSSYNLSFHEGANDKIAVLRSKLTAFNSKKTNAYFILLSAYIYDASGEMAAGAFGWAFHDRFHLDLLWVSEEIRSQGYGSQLLKKLEAEAIKRNCRFASVQTFSFQAPQFYLKHGFEQVGSFAPIANMYEWYFLRKELHA